METKHDSGPDTLAHINRVRELLKYCTDELTTRALLHDASKLREPERSGFDRLKALSLSGMVYGSDEYRACLRSEKPAIDHHYAHNSHHPEHYPKRDGGSMATMLRSCAAAQRHEATNIAQEKGAPPEVLDLIATLTQTSQFLEYTADQLEAQVNSMDLFDVMEMLMDWKAATERMKDSGDIEKSIEHNTGRFKLSPQLRNILENTARNMKWGVPTGLAFNPE